MLETIILGGSMSRGEHLNAPRFNLNMEVKYASSINESIHCRLEPLEDKSSVSQSILKTKISNNPNLSINNKKSKSNILEFVASSASEVRNLIDDNKAFISVENLENAFAKLDKPNRVPDTEFQLSGVFNVSDRSEKQQFFAVSH